MKKPLMIIGAGGHSRVTADIAILNGYEDVSFLDDAMIPGMRIVGSVSDYTNYLQSHVFFVGIGNNVVRETISKRIKQSGGELVNLIHPNAVIAPSVQLGKGIAVMAGAVINNSAVIEDGVIINTCSSVDHDCRVSAFAHVSVGAHLAGTVAIGERTMIGVGAAVINNCSICADCMIGAGAVVTKDIEETGTYIGVPARKI